MEEALIAKQTQNKKIYQLDELSQIIKLKHRGKKIIQCHGVFDLLHIGHIKHFNKAKEMGDILIVTITPDCFVNKGPGRPYFSEQLRAEAISSLDCVDYVVINKWPTAVEAIKIIKPHVYIKGSEYKNPENDITGKITDEEQAVKSIKGDIKYTEEMTFSSSHLLNRFFSNASNEINEYLKSFKIKHNFNDIINYFDQAKSLNVLVIGEAIIDIYAFCEALGKSGKEPVLVAKYDGMETYIGGILAIANHLGDFCQNVTCLTALGENKEYESFISSKLKNNVNLRAIYKKNSPTIIKKRFIDSYLKQKLFETYQINDEILSEEQENDLISYLKENIKKYDLVIVADYGHGFLNEKTIDYLSKTSKFLAVNTQSNAGNYGFNCISKYAVADYVCITGKELALAFRQRHLIPKENLKLLINQFGYKNITITTGSNGMLVYRQIHDDSIHEAPAFVDKVKDRVGAGDAVFAITSLLVALNADPYIVSLVGNVVGAEAVNIMGNESFIEKTAILKQLSHILK